MRITYESNHIISNIYTHSRTGSDLDNRNFGGYTYELQASRKKDNDTMKMKFLLHKVKEEKGKPSPQKQECGCPSLQPSLRSHTHAFFQPTIHKTT